MAIKSKPDHDRAAEAFLAKEPLVWQTWCEIIEEFAGRGFKTIPSNMVFEMVRGKLMLKRGTAFPINRNHRAYFVARWRRENHDRRDLLETRASPYTNAAYLDAGED